MQCEKKVRRSYIYRGGKLNYMLYTVNENAYCLFYTGSLFHHFPLVSPQTLYLSLSFSRPVSPWGDISHYRVHQSQKLWLNAPHTFLRTHTFISTHTKTHRSCSARPCMMTDPIAVTCLHTRRKYSGGMHVLATTHTHTHKIVHT